MLRIAIDLDGAGLPQRLLGKAGAQQPVVLILAFFAASKSKAVSPTTIALSTGVDDTSATSGSGQRTPSWPSWGWRNPNRKTILCDLADIRVGGAAMMSPAGSLVVAVDIRSRQRRQLRTAFVARVVKQIHLFSIRNGDRRSPGKLHTKISKKLTRHPGAVDLEESGLCCKGHQRGVAVRRLGPSRSVLPRASPFDQSRS